MSGAPEVRSELAGAASGRGRGIPGRSEQDLVGWCAMVRVAVSGAPEVRSELAGAASGRGRGIPGRSERDQD